MQGFANILELVAGLLALASLILTGDTGAEKLCWFGVALAGCVGALAHTGLG
jgi:hypothetical protein